MVKFYYSSLIVSPLISSETYLLVNTLFTSIVLLIKILSEERASIKLYAITSISYFSLEKTFLINFKFFLE